MASQFSSVGKYFCHLSDDGKLKVWDTTTSTLEQEFIPDFHLTSPCTCLQIVENYRNTDKYGSPKKKLKKRLSQDDLAPQIILGTTSGCLFIYSISKADVESRIDSGSSQPVICLSYNDGEIYSGSNQCIVRWDLWERRVKSKWKTNEKVTAILAVPERDILVTAAKGIKVWNIQTKEVLKTFMGHSHEITNLTYVPPRESASAYFISGSKGDRLLACWNLDLRIADQHSVASFVMDDICQQVSVSVGTDGSTNMAVVTRSGVAHVYKHTLNGKCGKPLKPKTTVQVASNSSYSTSAVPLVPVKCIFVQDASSLLVGYGNDLSMCFENLVLNELQKLHCIVRKDPRILGKAHSAEPSKVQTPIVKNDVHYVTPYTSSTTSKRKNRAGQIEVPMEQRLENLQLNKLETSSKVPRVDNVAQLLVQGLHSNDKNILRSVLNNQDVGVIKNTVKRLPMSVIVPLIKELTKLVQGKTGLSHIGALWLRYVTETHTALLLANPELPELIGPTLGTIESRLSLQMPLSALRGRLNLLVSQINKSNDQQNENEEPLLTFNDKDGSESEAELMDVVPHTDSENEWNEESSDDESVNNHEDNDDEMSS